MIVMADAIEHKINSSSDRFIYGTTIVNGVKTTDFMRYIEVKKFSGIINCPTIEHKNKLREFDQFLATVWKEPLLRNIYKIRIDNEITNLSFEEYFNTNTFLV
jgi:hypothetical protein